jgi:hypothetical protein
MRVQVKIASGIFFVVVVVTTRRCRRRRLGSGTLAAAMQQIADWLKMLRMSEYAERFAENRIDLSVLLTA